MLNAYEIYWKMLDINSINGSVSLTQLLAKF